LTQCLPDRLDHNADGASSGGDSTTGALHIGSWTGQDDGILIMKMKIFKEVIKSITTIIFTVAVPIIVFALLTSKTDAIFGIKSYNVLTGSMEPIIATGSMVFIQPSKSYSVGDIVTYKKGDITITHRIVSTKIQNGQLFYQTKGDANNSTDPNLVPANMVVGKVLFHIPTLGKLISLTKTPIGFIISIVLPTFIFVGFEVWEIKEEYKREVERKLLERLNMT